METKGSLSAPVESVGKVLVKSANKKTARKEGAGVYFLSCRAFCK
ncbi:hypothetical protein PC116_g23153 [Phytophthora cactorum]|nr:hypothetical protein PC116_g23153 [Phytophthora cactorum]